MSLQNFLSVFLLLLLLLLWVGKMIPLLLQMSPRPSLTISRADDTVLNFTKERTRLSSGLFAIH